MSVAVMDMQNWHRFHYENLSLKTFVVFLVDMLWGSPLFTLTTCARVTAFSRTSLFLERFWREF